MEISPAPLMLNIHLGAQAKRLMHGQLGLVLPSHDPIRLAEEIAIADHLLRGRLFVGMARGYQSRWMTSCARSSGSAPPTPTAARRIAPTGCCSPRTSRS
jgi:hypothetical protein